MSEQYLQFPGWDPVAISIGPLSVHWYGLNVPCWPLLLHYGGEINKPTATLTGAVKHGKICCFWGFLALIIGGRLGYVFFYNFDRLVADPIYLFRFGEGGMSFHGGLIGVITGGVGYLCKTHSTHAHERR